MRDGRGQARIAAVQETRERADMGAAFGRVVFSIFFSPISKNHVKLLPPNTYKKAFVLLLEGEPRNSSRALHRGRERDYSMSS